MKKEYIVASYEEDTSWINPEWYSFTSIYSCGNPIKNSDEKLSNIIENSFLNMHDVNHLDFHERPEFFRNLNSPLGSDSEYSSFIRAKNINKLATAIENFKKAVSYPTGDEDKYISNTKKQTNNVNLREYNIYLQHIINRYDVLADVNIFMQGQPHDQFPEYKKIFDFDFDPDFSFCCLSEQCVVQNLDPNFIFCSESIDFLNNLFNKKEKNYETLFCVGSTFAISKGAIRSKPKEWYEKVYDLCSDLSNSSHFLERTFWNVLGCPKITDIKL